MEEQIHLLWKRAKAKYNRSEGVNLSNQISFLYSHDLTTNSDLHKPANPDLCAAKVLSFIVMKHHKRQRFKMLSVSLPAGYIFGIFDRSTVCSLQGDQSSHVR